MPASERLVVDASDPDPAPVRRAAAALRTGQLVAFPTETVYGLGGDARDHDAIAAIFAGKGRPSTDPLIVHVPSARAAAGVVADWSLRAEQLAEAFWPGPLTMVLPRDPGIPPEVAAGRPTVAVRVPAHPVAAALLEAAGMPVVAPSANRFGRISPTTADHVEHELHGVYEVLLDAGPTPLGVESTVVDLSGDDPVMLRPGGVTLEDLVSVLGPVRHHERATAPESEALAAPGEFLRHYAPTTPLVLVEGPPGLVHQLVDALGAVGVDARSVELPAAPDDAARALYASLRHGDASGAHLLLAHAVDPSGLGRAVNDRLFRASHGRVVLDAESGTVARLQALTTGDGAG